MASVLAALAGLIVPAGCALAAWAVTGSPVRTMLAVTLAALLNTPSPLGGGMGAQGVLRVRWMRWERTFDADRSLFEAVAGTFLMSAVTAGGFFLAAPVLGLLLRWLGPLRTGVDELLSLGATVLLLAVGVGLHRSELSLRHIREQLERESEHLKPEALVRVVQQLSGLIRSDGGIGHVGGIGARTVGLHEHLEAEALLRRATERGTPGAAELHARCLEHLQSRAEPQGGFSAYPSGLPRVEYTARSLEALRGHLDEASLLRHRATLLVCRKEDGRFGRSVAAPASDDATTWAQRALGEV
jgi:hypothetical protein